MADPVDGAGPPTRDASDERASQSSVDDRGTLTVSSKAVESLVQHAVRGVTGTVESSKGPRLIGRRLPSASVSLHGDTASISLEVAAAWPCRAQEVAVRVRDTVRAEAARTSGLQIGRVDVTLHVVTPDPDEGGRVR